MCKDGNGTWLKLIIIWWLFANSKVLNYQRLISTWTSPIIELDDGKIYRKALYLMVKTMVSCRFSLKPTQWTNQPIHSPGFCWNFLESLHVRGQRRRGRRGPLNRTVPKHWWLRPARWGSWFFFPASMYHQSFTYM